LYIKTQVFDHHYHFDHLLDTAYEVEGHAYNFTNNNTPPEAASPMSSQGDLTELGARWLWMVLVGRRLRGPLRVSSRH
jgi:hypothetical protein